MSDDELQKARDENTRLQRDIEALNAVLRGLGYGQGEIDGMTADAEERPRRREGGAGCSKRMN